MIFLGAWMGGERGEEEFFLLIESHSMNSCVFLRRKLVTAWPDTPICVVLLAYTLQLMIHRSWILDRYPFWFPSGT